MNELNGPSVVIVLGVREGRGFDFLEHPLLIEASLKGHRIEADPVDPSPNPTVCTELVWETEKKEVRKLRSSHVPLRINCYACRATSREKIGFILLSLRSAAAVSNAVAATLEPQWHRLVSVPSEHRACRPELALTLTVRDRRPDSPAEQELNIPPVVMEEPQPNVVPIIYLEEGYIQIGHTSPNNQKFILSFVIRTANNLDLLLDEDLVFNSTSEKCYLALTILGLTINTKYFNKNLHEPIALNEKIVFKLITNLDIFKLFLEEFKSVPLRFHHGLKTLATAEICLKNLLQNEQLEAGIPCRDEQVLEFHVEENDHIELEGRTPSIVTETILEMKSEQSKLVSLGVEVTNPDNSIEESFNASGDQLRQTKTKSESTTSVTKSILSMEDAAVQTTPRECKISRSSLTLLKASSAKESLTRVSTNIDAADYRLFSLMIVFRSITWRKSLDIEGFQFKFQHPKANQALIINCELQQMNPSEIMMIEDVCCIMYFLSTEENIKNLVSLYPPTISLQTYDDKNLVDEFLLYTKLLLKDGENSCDYFAVLNSVENKDELVCDLQIEMKLNEVSSGFSMKYDDSDFNLEPIILDDWLALKTVKDLEEWKNKQEILFKDNLKRLECEKLEILQAEWNVKRVELETKLHQGMEKCKVLSEQLSITANDLRIKKRCLDEKLLTSPESRENIEIQVTQMLEDEMNKNVQRIEAEKERLLKRIEEIEQEKITLEEKIRAKDNELEEMRKTTLTREQTACLLQELRHLEEKFQQAQMEKSFFKQQWHTALKEVHALKAEDTRQLQQDIRRKKEELSQLSLDGDIDSGDITDQDNDASFDPNVVPMDSYLY